MPLNTLGFDPEDIRDPVTHQPLGTEPIPTGIEEFDIQEEKPPEEHKKWKDHINQDYYKDLDATEQENFRRQYFEHRVAPQVPEDDQFNARMQFDVYSAQDVIGKQHKQSRFSSAGGSLARSFGKMVASLPKAVGEGAVNLANKFGDDPIWGNPEKITPEQTTSYKAGEAIEKWFDKFTVNPEYQDEFWTSDIPEGAGYMLGFMAGGAAGKIAEIPVLVTTMGLGAAATGVEGVEDYLSTLSDDEKADPEMRESAFNLNAVLGTSEGLPISRILDRIDGVTGGGVKRILKEGFKGGLEELTQEVLQSVGQNAIAAKLLEYDPDRSLLTGTKEAGEVGFTLGFMLNTLAAMIGSRRTGKAGAPPGAPPVEPTVEPALEGELLGPEQLGAPDERQDAMDTYMDVLEQKALPPPVEDTLAAPTTPEIGQTGDVGHITAKVDPETGHELIEDLPLEDTGVELLSGPQEDRREQVSINPMDERRSGDRRVDAQLRERVADMTPEEQYQAIYVDRMTGLHNRRAFEDLPWRNHLASIDVDSLKWVNDTMSPDTGDQMLSEVGKAIDEAIGDSSVVDGYHISGDEYYVQADTQEEADAILAKANEILAGKTLTHEGKGITKEGINITWGTSTHKDLADQLMKDEKKAKEAKGERAGRGETPPGVTMAEPVKAEEKEAPEAPQVPVEVEPETIEVEPVETEEKPAEPVVEPEVTQDPTTEEPSLAEAVSFGSRPIDQGEFAFILRNLGKYEIRKGNRREILERGKKAGILTEDNRLDVSKLSREDRQKLRTGLKNLPAEQAYYETLASEIIARLDAAEKAERKAQLSVITGGKSEQETKPVVSEAIEIWADISPNGRDYTTYQVMPGEEQPSLSKGHRREKLGDVASQQEWYAITDGGFDIGRKSVQELKASIQKSQPQEATPETVPEFTQETLQLKNIPEIRTIQRELGIPAKGKKADAIQSILNATQAPVEGTQVTVEPVSEGEATQDANEQKSKQEAADAIARDRKAVTPADAVRNIDETGCPK